MQSICPKCGQPTEQGLCLQCTQDATKLFQCPDQVEIVLCSICGARQIKGKWQIPDERSIEELSSQAAVNSLWFHKDFAKPDIGLNLKKVGATRYLAEIEITGNFEGQEIAEHCEIPVRIKL
ncbi:MAG: hypothetical protein EHM14_14295, partial [Methanothrix sp.]